jgi:RNA polymerase sigma factor (sigma-70 family)
MTSLYQHLDDEALWNKIREENLEAFEVVYNRFFKHLYNYGRKICSSPVTVEDAIHDLFLDLWKYRLTISSTTSVKFYLYRALRRKIVKNDKKDSDTSVFEFDIDELLSRKTLSHEDDLIETEIHDQRVIRLKKHLNNLPPRQYEALVLKFYDDLSYPQIAELLGINEQSARNLVQRGLEQLRSFTQIFISITAVFLSLAGLLANLLPS